MPPDKPVPEFEVDDPIWVHWSNRTEAGWITSVQHIEYPTKPGQYFVMYGVLQRDGKDFDRVASRLIEKREV